MEGRGKKLVSLAIKKQVLPPFRTTTELNNLGSVGITDQREEVNKEETMLPIVENSNSNSPKQDSPCPKEFFLSSVNHSAYKRRISTSISYSSTSLSSSFDSEESISILTKQEDGTSDQKNKTAHLIANENLITRAESAEINFDLTASSNDQTESSHLVLTNITNTCVNSDSLVPHNLARHLNSDGEDFLPDDSGDEYQPEKQKYTRKRKISSSSSCSSTSSSSNSSSSNSSTSDSIARSPNFVQNTNAQINEPSQNADKKSLSPKKNTKKKVRNEGNWKKNVTKKLRNSGQQYKSRTGKIVPAKVMRPPCTDKCRYLCSNKFSEEQRRELFDMYWNLSSLQRQRDFLNFVIHICQPAQRRVKSKTENRKPNTYCSLINNGQNIRVCKTFLLNTLGIADRTLRTVIEAKTNEGFQGGAPNDNRGKHGKHFKNDPEVLESVRNHINSITRIESHYLRANTTREYIDGGLTIAELHRDYKRLRESNNKIAANYDAYFRIFNMEFNISFFVPKKDQCDLCESIKNSVDDEELKKKYVDHLHQKDLSRAEKKNDIQACKIAEKNSTVAIYDLQAVMPVPIGESSAFFYKSKLNCLNLTITDIKNQQTICYFWHEGMGSRGATEIGSCVYKFLQNISEKDPNSDVIFYTDNCGGQQKNRFIFSMYLYAVKTLQINTITHKFLIRGHTQNEGDIAHSIIEKAIKRSKKSGPIYVPDQYVQIIRSAKKTKKPFVVEEMNYDDFYDLKILTEEIGLNTTKDTQGNIIKTNDLKIIQFQKDAETYRYKNGYDEDWVKVEIKIMRPRSKGDAKEIKNINIKPAYRSKIPITQNKKNDLRELIQKNIIPRYYSSFYESIFNI